MRAPQSHETAKQQVQPNGWLPPISGNTRRPRDDNEVTEHLERATMRPQDSHSSHQTDNSRHAAPRRASLRAVLLATSALASAALPITVAHADPVDSTWLA